MNRLSVIVPLLNEAARLPALVASLQGLRQRGAELLLADGGSSDGSPALLQAELPERIDAWVEAPRGRARQMNAAAAQASGDWLLFLHADTELPPGADALIRSCTERWGRFDVRIAGRSRWLPLVAWCMNRRSRWTGIATGDQAIFIERGLFEQLGGFPDQALMEDIELCKRLKARSLRPACLHAQVITSGRRWDERGALRTIVLMWQLRWRYWRGETAERLAEAYR
ncbi:TIGR04283 family arsenosugar biosynthesis glycosyltransferase [Pseudorhodoferax sp.]|uniref:TIGR04283 family arsenosugar biosynthesis glycosyltransferase n=1 Tax=Pseudorhodoferax sp. TaxID=1993553 RepID=UPI001B540FBD|nr:TIGR04283 family arsenosugar biosynthesis glycosyltransferase [Pseudorhodoferax sp.]MBP8144478.1 TIGR04283 family arsenosugar biosynthesis glycosyltransferase [Inhella sp.]